MGERQGVGIAARPEVVWPPDDTEESVLGTNLHQWTIGNLWWGLNEVAAALTVPGGEPPWQAYMQSTITGWRRPDGSAYTTLPDVYVYRQAIDLRRPSLSLGRDGVPLLIVEVLSPTTYRVDLDLAAGKGYSFAQAGVPEYLTLDPLRDYLPEGERGWRLGERGYTPWPPDADGRWRSEVIGVAIGLEGVQVAVYAPDGRRQLREGEVNPELARRDEEYARELARRAEEIADLRHRLERRDAE